MPSGSAATLSHYSDGIKRQQTATDLHGYPRTRLHEWVIMDMRCDMKRDSNEIEISKPTTVEAVHALVALVENPDTPAEVRVEVAVMLLDMAGHRPYRR